MLALQPRIYVPGGTQGMQSPTRIVALLREPERSGMRFERLADDFPGVDVVVASSLEEAAPALDDAEVLITIGNHLGADAEAVYRQATGLKWIQSFGTGVDNIKGHPALHNGVTVTNVHGVHGPQLSEAAFAAMLVFRAPHPGPRQEPGRGSVGQAALDGAARQVRGHPGSWRHRE